MDGFKQPKQSLRRKKYSSNCILYLNKKGYLCSNCSSMHTHIPKRVSAMPRFTTGSYTTCQGHAGSEVRREMACTGNYLGPTSPVLWEVHKPLGLWTSGNSLTNMQEQRWNGFINKENLQISLWVNPILILYKNTYQYNEKKKIVHNT